MLVKERRCFKRKIRELGVPFNLRKICESIDIQEFSRYTRQLEEEGLGLRFGIRYVEIT